MCWNWVGTSASARFDHRDQYAVAAVRHDLEAALHGLGRSAWGFLDSIHVLGGQLGSGGQAFHVANHLQRL